jgi:hypothetical protein
MTLKELREQYLKHKQDDFKGISLEQQCKMYHKIKDLLTQQIVRPNCCLAAQHYPSIVFRLNDYYDTENSDGHWHITLIEPSWDFVFGKDYSGWSDEKPDVKFCPYCGKPLPKMVRTKPGPDQKICKITDGGYYCDTCGERCDNCICDLAESVFVPEENLND